MQYDVVIGIETHIQLKTATKMFCRCSAAFFDQPVNSHTCPVCLGLPGALPTINKVALDQAILMGLALQATIAEHSHFDRKNYFYPDLAKGYQISQYDEPLAVGGGVEVGDHRIGLIRAHLEEDVGKLSHSSRHSLVDFNKGGVPLLEIVSEPVIQSAAEAKAYVQQLRQIARYIGVNDGNLEQGTMRADINISLQEPGKWSYDQGEFSLKDGYRLHKRVEVKNVNSFRAIERAVDYEIKRQAALLEAGQEVEQETRGWNEAKGVTTSQRGKEDAHDYRYFPEPDLPPLVIDRQWVDQLSQALPELPRAKYQRFIGQYGLSDYEARLLTEEKANADWFEAAVTAAAESDDTASSAKLVANWMLGELARLQNDQQVLVADSQLLPAQLASVLEMLRNQTISATSAKQIVAEAYISGKDPRDLVKEWDLEQVSGSNDLRPIAEAVVAQHADAVANYKNGKVSSLMFLVGQVMKATQGRAKPDVVKQLLEQLLDS
jgi:aspartyl-tRNA(Asn)/glutamyl-tRNA(Gln) amidotransferase subunit B